jgi:hypothetical protein
MLKRIGAVRGMAQLATTLGFHGIIIRDVIGQLAGSRY